MTPALGPLFLYSTSPRPAFARVIDLALARRRPTPGGVKVVFLTTPLEDPQPDDVEKLRADISGLGVDITVIDPGPRDRADAARPEVVNAILDADIVLGSGGDPATFLVPGLEDVEVAPGDAWTGSPTG